MEGIIARIRLDHCDASGGLSEECCADVMRDEMKCLVKCPQSGWESVLVSPTRPAAVEQRIIEVRSMIIVVSGEKQTLRERPVSSLNGCSTWLHAGIGAHTFQCLRLFQTSWPDSALLPDGNTCALSLLVPIINGVQED